jgi:hypothetical protein
MTTDLRRFACGAPANGAVSAFRFIDRNGHTVPAMCIPSQFRKRRARTLDALRPAGRQVRFGRYCRAGQDAEDNAMSTQDVPGFLARKLTGVALLVVGGLLAVYGINYGATAATVFGAILGLAGIVILLLKIMRRNQDYG